MGSSFSVDRDDRLQASNEAWDELEDLRALVTVSRTHPSDAKQRQVIVRIDDGPKQKLYFGESFTLEVTPGEHRLHAHNTLFIRKLKFTVEPGEHLEFVIVNKANAFTWTMAGVLGSAPMWLKIYRRSVT
jgi:hypothetical protein